MTGSAISSGSMTLRLSVTDRCNYHCAYCMPTDGIAKLRKDDLPRLEELVAAVAWLQREFAVTRVKLTGGEPLVRRGVVELVRMLVALSGIEEVSMTSNGSLLSRYATEMKQAGLARVNVSLDSLDSQRYAVLTGGANLADAVAGIDAAIAAGLLPVKLNTVLRASSWRQDVPALLDFAWQRNLEVRFIELMRTGTARQWAEREYVAAEEVRGWLAGCTRVEDIDETTRAPARRTRVNWRGKEFVVGWITPRSNPFCDGCNRLRLDAGGSLRRCLMDPLVLPLLSLLQTRPSGQVREQVALFLAGKRPPLAMDTELPMSAVGG
jgi:cyclic pyranopterin phosphate synthase